MYPPIPNMGDLLNKDMLEELFNIKVVRKDLKSCNLIAIGSALDHIMYSTYPRIRAKQKIEHFMNDNVHIWSTGFIRGNVDLDLGLIFRHIHIHALRGRLSLQRMENILGKSLMCRQVTEDFLPKVAWILSRKSIVSELSRTLRNRITLLWKNFLITTKIQRLLTWRKTQKGCRKNRRVRIHYFKQPSRYDCCWQFPHSQYAHNPYEQYVRWRKQVQWLPLRLWHYTHPLIVQTVICLQSARWKIITESIRMLLNWRKNSSSMLFQNFNLLKLRSYYEKIINK